MDRQSPTRRIKHLEGHEREFPRLRIQRQSWFLLRAAACDASTLDAVGKECTPETYVHRIILMGTMSEWRITDKPHKNDHVRIQKAQEIRDDTARFWPGYWIFVGPGSENTWSYDKWEAENPSSNLDRTYSHIV